MMPVRAAVPPKARQSNTATDPPNSHRGRPPRCTGGATALAAPAAEAGVAAGWLAGPAGAAREAGAAAAKAGVGTTGGAAGLAADGSGGSSSITVAAPGPAPLTPAA